MTTAQPLVQMQGIVKRFPGVVANDQVDLELRAGQVHALLGENGAGKTTLMNVLYGIYRPDAGTILVRGHPRSIRSPREALSLGIGMVHQHFRLVYPHTVAENVALGLPSAPFFFTARGVRRALSTFSRQYGLEVDPQAFIWQLSAGEQQRVEILKALYRGVDILILDEPTSMLTPQESQELFASLEKMSQEGKAVILITHKLEEVIRASHQVTVLRRGRNVATRPTHETSEKELARLMVGREILFRLEKKATAPGDTVLAIEDLHALNDKGLPALRGISLTIREGEIVGIAGVAGNGQRELVEVLTGLRPARKGQLRLQGVDIQRCTPREMLDQGVFCIPEERIRQGIASNMSVAENLILKIYRDPPCSTGLLLNPSFIRDYAQELTDRYDVITPSLRTPAKLLSGGNIQRLILARELDRNPRLLIAAHPTSGLDIGATEFIRQQLLAQRERGSAILLISEDLQEVLTLSDRVAVIFEGKLMGIMPAEEADIDEIGLMMAGVKEA